jgi:hypothetical protein
MRQFKPGQLQTGSIYNISSSYALTASYALNGGTGVGGGNYIATGSVTASVSTGTGSFTITSGSSTFMFVSSSGNVGIGTNTPGLPLDVSGSVRLRNNTIIGGTLFPTSAWTSVLVIGNDGTDKIITGYLSSSTNGAVIGAHNSALNAWSNLNVVGSNIVFRRLGEVEAMRINSSSNVLIGTATDAGYRFLSSGTGVSGSVNLDNTLYVSGSRVGIGTSTPTNAVDITQASSGFLSLNRTAGASAALSITNIRTGGGQGLVIDSTGGFSIRNGSNKPFIIDGLRVGIGTDDDALVSRLQVKGSGATASTTAFLVQNSNATSLFSISDNGNISIGLGTTTFSSTGWGGGASPSSSIYFNNGVNDHEVNHQMIFRASLQGLPYTYLKFPTGYSSNFQFIGAGAGVALSLSNSGSAESMVYTHNGVSSIANNIPFVISATTRTLTYGGGTNDVNHLAPYTIILKGNQALNTATNTPGGDVYVLGGLPRSGSGSPSGSVYIFGGTVNTQNTLYVSGSNVGIGTSTPTSTLDIRGTQIATSSIARTMLISSSLSASANNNILVGLDINPSYNTGSFTGVTNYGIRIASSTQAGNNGGQIAVQATDGNPGIIGMQGGGWNALGFWGVGRYSTTSTPDLRIFSTGNVIVNTKLLINATADAGYNLDVNGTVRSQGTLTVGAGGQGQITAGTLLLQ